MKDIKGWITLLLFAVSCFVIGSNRFLMKSLNATVTIMLIISVVLVIMLNYKKGEDEK